MIYYIWRITIGGIHNSFIRNSSFLYRIAHCKFTCITSILFYIFSVIMLLKIFMSNNGSVIASFLDRIAFPALVIWYLLFVVWVLERPFVHASKYAEYDARFNELFDIFLQQGEPTADLIIRYEKKKRFQLLGFWFYTIAMVLSIILFIWGG